MKWKLVPGALALGVCCLANEFLVMMKCGCGVKAKVMSDVGFVGTSKCVSGEGTGLPLN